MITFLGSGWVEEVLEDQKNGVGVGSCEQTQKAAKWSSQQFH